MNYQTPADVVELEQARLRAALRWAVAAFGLGLLGMALSFLGQRISSPTLRVIGFGVGAGGVLLGFLGVVRAGLVIVAGLLRR